MSAKQRAATRSAAASFGVAFLLLACAPPGIPREISRGMRGRPPAIAIADQDAARAAQDDAGDALPDSAAPAPSDALPSQQREDVAPPPTYWGDLHAVFHHHCLPCHGADGPYAAAHTLADDPRDATLPSVACPGMTRGACAWERVRRGEMPLNAGCTGDPEADAGKALCLSAREQGLLRRWVEAGMPVGDPP